MTEARTLFGALTRHANLARGSAQAERQRPAYGWLAELFARRGAAEDAFEAQQWAARTSLDDALAHETDGARGDDLRIVEERAGGAARKERPVG